jgi:superfamily II DNA or RNA helicase
MKILFDHQEKMVKAAENSCRGIIQCPTGSGKTLAQAEIVARHIESNSPSIILIKSPRIGLSNQLAKEYIQHLSDRGINLDETTYFLAHSGESADFDIEESLTEEEKMEIWDTLPENIDAISSGEEIKSRIKRSQELERNVIIFTTYHSNIKVYEIIKRLKGEVNLDINDEGHYLVREDFKGILETYSPKRQYFFTATLVETASKFGKGMNNQERFGEILYFMSVTEAISKGIILPLKVKLIRSEAGIMDQDIIDNEVGEIIEKAFSSLQKSYRGMGAKMIVSTKGANQIRVFLGSPEFPLLVKRGVNILTVHSVKKLVTHNGKEITRKEFDAIKNQIGGDLKSKMIIVHYDILSEGIDIQGLQGALILRKMGISKFYQNVGRAVRVLRGLEKLKKNGMLMFPDITDPDMKKEFNDFIMGLRKEGFIPKEIFSEQNAKGEAKEEDQFDGLEGKEGRSLSHDIDLMLKTEEWEEEMEKMTEEEELAFIKSYIR